MKNLTNHGEQRLRKRSGINKNAVKRNLKLALERGVSHKNFTGAFRKYLETKAKRGADLIVYNQKIYVVRNEHLITLLDIPSRFKNINLKRTE